MHIAIEGLDGSGKTSTARRVADLLGFEFIEKPMHYFTDSENSFENYMMISEKINSSIPGIRARFYGVGNYYVSELGKQQNIVTDRHLASNYYWNCQNDEDYFRELVMKCGSPDLTVVLYVDENERRERIHKRNSLDKDLERNVFDNSLYNVIEHFLKKYQMEYLFIDATNLRLEEVVAKIMCKVNSINSRNNKLSLHNT